MLLVCGAHRVSRAQTAPHSGSAPCVLRAKEYQCDRATFQERLRHARTVRIDTDRMDPFAAGELRRMMPGLGLTVATQGSRPDLIVVLAPVDHSGRIDFGPSDMPLATLSLYDPAKGTGPSSLLWVETFTGQQDRPWPSVVTGLLQQFKEHAVSHEGARL